MLEEAGDAIQERDYQCRCRAKPVFDVSKVNIDVPFQIQWDKESRERG